MATRKPLVKITGSPNKIQEMPAADTLDPASAGLAVAFAGTTDTQTLTNKTLTTPRIGTVKDTSGLDVLTLTPTASAVNNLLIANSATGSAVTVSTGGASSDATVSLNVVPKGAGELQVNGVGVITASSTTTLTNKTHTTPRLTKSETLRNALDLAPAATNAGTICDSAGVPVLALLESGSGGTILAIRGQIADTLSSEKLIAFSAASTDTNAGFVFRPLGSGRLRERVGSSNIAILNEASVVCPTDYRALANPSGAAATAIGQQPAGMRLCSGLASDSQPVTNNILYWFPFVAPRNGAATVSLTNITLSTGAANAVGSNARVGIYSTQGATATYPGDSGTSLVTGSEAVLAMPAAASTVVASGALTVSLTPGSLYWLAVVMETNNCIMRCWNAAAPAIPVIGCYGEIGAAGTTLSFFGTTTQLTYTGWKAAFTYAALPANSAPSGSLADLFQFTNVNAASTPNIMALLKYGS